jgi:hypothetical protein
MIEDLFRIFRIDLLFLKDTPYDLEVCYLCEKFLHGAI